MSAYFGTVESQGRATLHLHLLVWLENAPTSEETSMLLHMPEFCEKVSNFIQANLCAYLPGLESQESVQAIPRERDIAFNRPPNPDCDDYEKQLSDFELWLARTEQVHTCKIHRCLVQDKFSIYRL